MCYMGAGATTMFFSCVSVPHRSSVATSLSVRSCFQRLQSACCPQNLDIQIVGERGSVGPCAVDASGTCTSCPDCRSTDGLLAAHQPPHSPELLPELSVRVPRWCWGTPAGGGSWCSHVLGCMLSVRFIWVVRAVLRIFLTALCVITSDQCTSMCGTQSASLLACCTSDQNSFAWLRLLLIAREPCVAYLSSFFLTCACMGHAIPHAQPTYHCQLPRHVTQAPPSRCCWCLLSLLVFAVTDGPTDSPTDGPTVCGTQCGLGCHMPYLSASHGVLISLAT